MGMKVVYKNATGEIVAIGTFPDYVLKDGESVIDVPTADPAKIKDMVVDHGVLRVKNATEIASDTAAVEKEKADKKNRKSAILTKLKLDKSDIQGLVELVQDGNDS